MSGDLFAPGVVTGDRLMRLLQYLKDHKAALPAVNCTSTQTINAAMEAARDNRCPIVIQFSQGGATSFAGKGLDNKNMQASILGAVAGANYVRRMAKAYGAVVVLHSDHCAKKLLPWFDGMLAADEAYFAVHGEPLFSSHMLDLSVEDLDWNIATCQKYLRRMARIDCLLEMELGITGGEEDGVDHSGVENSRLYTQPEEVYQVYSGLAPISHMFTIAASFGNVHGVYAPGGVKLQPEILGSHQTYVAQQIGSKNPKPLFFVFHGGSGSDAKDLATAVSNGVIKFNIDTDTQWAFWSGVLQHYKKYEGYLQGQVGNPEGPEKPNKKKYDPRTWLRAAEKSMISRLTRAFAELNGTNLIPVQSRM
jgi:fructose-bisphosphate aldolase class II